MRHCPNADCPFRKRYRHASEFADTVTECRDCGATLVEGEATSAAKPLHPFPFLAVAMTLLAAAASIALTRIPLPGVAPPRFAGELDPTKMSIGLLGLMPFVSASVIVELAAVAVPRWRRLRTEGRTKLVRAALFLTLLLAVVQSYGIVTYLRSVPFELAIAPALLMLTMVAGVFAQLALARLVDRHGLGNGVATLIAASVAAGLVDTARRAWSGAMIDANHAIIGAAVLAGVVLATAWLVGRKVSDRGVTLRAPLSGVDPLVSAAAAMQLPRTLASLGVAMPPIPLTPGGGLYAIVLPTLVVVFTVTLSFLFHLPKNVAAATGAGRDAILAARRKALRPTLFYLGALTLADLVLVAQAPLGIAVGQVALVAVVVLDLVEEADARRRAARWVSFATIHRTYELDPLLDRLAEQKIDALPRALRTRTFFQFFAPWAPVEVLIPAEHEARARDAAAPRI